MQIRDEDKARAILWQYLTQCRLDQYSRERRTQEGSQEHRLLYVFSIVFLWISPNKLQENVEAHLGGPDVEVEPTLKQFQDALAYALVPPLGITSSCGTVQEVSVYGRKLNTTTARTRGEDPRH
jgi:hypothetical protein